MQVDRNQNEYERTIEPFDWIINDENDDDEDVDEDDNDDDDDDQQTKTSNADKG